jgi:nitrogenase-associated protein
MAIIDFYEKPGCINNARQKQLLGKAGHVLVVHNLLQQNWAEKSDKLRSFFGDMPVVEWFNRSAPQIKNAEIDPAVLTETQAIACMIEQPLLIRRPLLEVNGRRCAGFDAENIAGWLEIAETELSADLETCPKSQVENQP